MSESIKKTLAVAACAALFVAPAIASAGDHLACYKVKDTIQKKSLGNVTLVSDIGLPTKNGCVIQTGARICCDAVEKQGVPPQTNGTTDPGPDAPGYCCYKVKCPAGADVARNWHDQFGDRNLLLRHDAPGMICAPVNSCDGSLIPCSGKSCGAGKVCGDTGLGICGCVDEVCTAPTACGDTAFPTCDGACPSGEACTAMDIAGNTSCVCQQVATACNAATATCSAGDCATFFALTGTCTTDGGSCACVYGP